MEMRLLEVPAAPSGKLFSSLRNAGTCIEQLPIPKHPFRDGTPVLVPRCGTAARNQGGGRVVNLCTLVYPQREGNIRSAKFIAHRQVLT